MIKSKKYKFFPNNRRGWIQILESVISVLLIAGFILFLSDVGNKVDPKSEKIYTSENFILREIQFQEEFRSYILGTSGEVEFNSFNQELKDHIENRIPDYLGCYSMICSLTDSCIYAEDSIEEIFVKSVIISADSEIYNPRQIKLFCWEI